MLPSDAILCQNYTTVPCDGVATCNNESFDTDAEYMACVAAAEAITDGIVTVCANSRDSALTEAGNTFEECTDSGDGNCTDTNAEAITTCDNTANSCNNACALEFPPDGPCFLALNACLTPCDNSVSTCLTACFGSPDFTVCANACNKAWIGCQNGCFATYNACVIAAHGDLQTCQAGCTKNQTDCFIEACTEFKDCNVACGNTQLSADAGIWNSYYDCIEGSCSKVSSQYTECMNTCAGGSQSCNSEVSIASLTCGQGCNANCCDLEFENFFDTACSDCNFACEETQDEGIFACASATSNCQLTCWEADLLAQKKCGWRLAYDATVCEVTYQDEINGCEAIQGVAILMCQADEYDCQQPCNDTYDNTCLPPCAAAYNSCTSGCDGNEACLEACAAVQTKCQSSCLTQQTACLTSCSDTATTCNDSADNDLADCQDSAFADRYECRYTGCVNETYADEDNKCVRDCFFSSGCDCAGSNDGSISCCEDDLNSCLTGCPDAIVNEDGEAYLPTCNSCGSFGYAAFALSV